MERLIRCLLLAWLALLLAASVLLRQPFFPWLSYGLMVAAVGGLPVVLLLMLGQMVLGLREAWLRIQVLRRAAKWPRLRRERDASSEEWWKQEL